MRDLIDRQTLNEYIRAQRGRPFVGITLEDAILMMISEVPSVQSDIIACGDCKHWICHDKRCGYWNHGVKPLDWCCHAERRTDEQTE